MATTQTTTQVQAPGSTQNGRADAGERGAALVEFSIVSLLLLTMIFGAIELSLAWADTLVLDQSSRSAARVGARMTNDDQADREALRALVSNLESDDLAQVEFVVIYQAGVGGAMPPGCETASSSSCNRYPAAALAELDDDSKWGCGGGTYDSSWCPTDRDPQLHSPVNLGVYVEARRSWITAALPSGGIDLSSETVMRLDPLVR